MVKQEVWAVLKQVDSSGILAVPKDMVENNFPELSLWAEVI